MTETIRTVVDMDAVTFWKLAAIAETHGMRVPDYLAELGAVASNQQHPVLGDPIIRRWRQGMTDAQIAAELGLTNLHVATHRRSHRLPANKKTNKEAS